MDPFKIQRTLIALALAGGHLPFERMLFEPEDGNGGGGGGTPAAGGAAAGTPAVETPKYTDKQLNDLIAKNAAKEVAKFKAEAEAAQKLLREELEAAKNEAALAGKSAEEKAKLIADSDAKKRASEQERIAKDLATAQAEASKAKLELRSYKLSNAASAALAEAKVLPSSASAATKLFMLEAQVDLEDDGSVKGITLDGTYHKTMKEAAEAFLKSNPYFAPAPAGGSGTPRAGGQLGGGAKVSDLTPAQLMAMADEADQARGIRSR